MGSLARNLFVISGEYVQGDGRRKTLGKIGIRDTGSWLKPPCVSLGTLGLEDSLGGGEEIGYLQPAECGRPASIAVINILPKSRGLCEFIGGELEFFFSV